MHIDVWKKDKIWLGSSVLFCLGAGKSGQFWTCQVKWGEGGCWQLRQVSTSRRHRCSKLKYGWHCILYIVHAALCRSKEMLGGKILLTTAFKCWLLVCSSTSHGHWQAGLLYKVHKVHHTRFTRFTVQGSHGSLYKVHKVHYTSSTSHGHWQAGWCTIQGSAQWFSWWYVAVDFIWIWQTKDSKRLANMMVDGK